MLPFLIPDFIKACAAAAVAVRLKSFFDIYNSNFAQKKVQ
jgi:biotin transporter BioY